MVRIKVLRGWKAEMKRVSWPDRKRVAEDTATVLVVALVLGALLAGLGGVCGLAVSFGLSMLP